MLLFSVDVLSRPSNINVDFTSEELEYLSQQKNDYLNKRNVDDPTSALEILCNIMIDVITETLTDPEIGVTPEQLLLIPKFNKKTWINQEDTRTCLQEYGEWISNLNVLRKTTTDDQNEKN
ncbi:unnamed protein product [Adineta steineri]|uniref:Uncharacterized protein n=1 Tax=Adineta steineri TaxID=433720 RepID=A0A819GB51_9BILA|nr:unnamed protein product [Adineta steineri]CAF3876961.1 unnamed protein product [Adineta steineri]CAF4305491.1 unnamed protein product [Adineta steineri]